MLAEEHIKQIEKKTFRLHLFSQICGGICMGIAILQDVILKKSLGGTDFQIMLLAFLTSSAFLVSIYGTELINRSENRSRTILIVAVCGKLFLFILPFVNNSVFYITCIAINAFSDSMLLSSWNIVFKHNYTEARRSKLYSYASTLSTVFALVFTTLFGYFLDLNYELYKLFFPMCGVFGIIHYYNLSKMMKLSSDTTPVVENLYKGSFNYSLFKDILLLPFRQTRKILAENPRFLKFEMNFFLYGMAFMCLSPAIPVFLVDNLHLSYAPISIAKGFIFHSALIMFTPLMGKFHGSKNVWKFCGYSFLVLVAFPLILISGHYFAMPVSAEFITYISFFIFGVGMSGVTIAWALSSINFAPASQVSNYQAVHITLTGLRGVFSPALGYIVMKMFSIEATFILGAFLFFAGSVGMFWQSRK